MVNLIQSMNRDFFTKERLSKGYYSYLAAMITLVILPVHIKFLPPCMILWCLVWIIENYHLIGKFWQTTKLYIVLFILFIVYYLWQAFSITYTYDVKLGLSNLFGRLSLIVFPLVLLHPGETIIIKIKILLKVFAIGTFAFIVFCFCHALYGSVYFQNGHWTFNPHPSTGSWLNNFYGSDLTVTQHPTYIAMYVVVAFFICFESWYDKRIRLRNRVFWLITGMLLLISQYFLSSRAGILVSIVLCPVYFILKFRKLGKRKLAWAGILLVIFLLVPVIVHNQRVDYLSGYLAKKTDYPREKDPRLITWRSALSVAKDHPIFGVGIGDVRAELISEYQRVGEDAIAGEKLNAHNQFLEVLVENGIIGVIIFLSIFFFMTKIAWQQKNLMYGLFIIAVFLFFQFESMLYRLAGVSFFSLFSFLLLHLRTENYIENKPLQDSREL